ncbi:penicillin-binding protein PBP4(5) [Kurthia sibirica]|uniref:Penicillin-binding protein n=1 Tax=Kurthia sibirica TaxID=202750 RepID=A0A2U3AQ31_9BACL|nr:penicillin-binding transpeptidase domain-containing protein [Kurthia sibirica]PWI26629.1 penicillin-binding protein [Kurthia sibirica]GEK32886.1 D-alanyl-D-alanine carboxypeptidase [Kurthia sibirica]
MNKRTLIIAISSIFALVLLIGGYFILTHEKNNNAQEKIAQQWISSLKNQEFEQIATLTTASSLKKQNYSAEELTAKYTTIFSGLGVEKVKISNIHVENMVLTYSMQLHTTIGKTTKFNYRAKIVKEDVDYKIAWQPNLIFPNMKATDKISLSNKAAIRGSIVDANNMALATQQKAFQAGIIPKELGNGAERKKNIAAISRFLDMPVTTIEAHLNKAWVKEFLFVPLKVVADEDVRKVTGLQYKATETRYYPLGEAAANLIGYTGKVTAEDIKKKPSLNTEAIIGKAGLERAYDAQLRGMDGGTISLTDEAGKVKDVLLKSEVENGQTIKLTIDAFIQKRAYHDLEKAAGSNVIMQPKTGALIALVSKPSFDPNQMVRGISQKAYDQYANNKNNPFMSRFAQRYAPGSTMKAITAAVGLDSGILTTKTQRKISGLQWQKNASWGKYKVTRVTANPVVDFEMALVESDNIFFAQEGLALGEKKLRAGFEKFGFGQDYDLPFAMEPAQISSDKKFNNDILLADTAYGQGQLLMSPIQQAVAYSAFANDGKIVRPHIIYGEKSVTSQAASKKAINQVNTALKKVVSSKKGTAHLLASNQYTLAAKTGTAELKLEQGTEGIQNSFLMVFDAQKKNYISVSVVENHKKTGSTATELAKDLIPELEKLTYNEK